MKAVISLAVLLVSFSGFAQQTSPVNVYFFDTGTTNVPPDLTNAIAVSTSALDYLVVRADGTVTNLGASWSLPSVSNVVAVAAGANDAIALQANGTVIRVAKDNGWGSTYVPPGLTNVVAIAGGSFAAGMIGTSAYLALNADGTVAAWGGAYSAPPPTNLSLITAVAVNLGSGLALGADGTVVCWGQTLNICLLD